MLRLQGLVGRLDQLLCGERLVDRVPEVHLRGQRGAGIVGLIVSVGNRPSRDGLGNTIPAMIRRACGDPGEELLHRALAVGLDFAQTLAGELNIQILCAGQTQRGRQVNWVWRIVGRLRIDRAHADREAPRRENGKWQMANHASHFASTGLTGWPSASVCFPTRITGWSSFNAQAVAAFVNDFGLDGVDIDYEPSNANCTSNGQTVSCPSSDTEYVSVVSNMRAAMPRPKWLSIAAWSVGAYGENQWANALPAGSAYMGIAIAVFKNSSASVALDLVNVMSYDASSAYDPRQALAAYQYYFKGRIAMGIEVPPEAWGGHVYTISEIDSLADAVSSSNAAGLMLWSIQKSGATQQFATEMCTKLALGNCSTSML